MIGGWGYHNPTLNPKPHLVKNGFESFGSIRPTPESPTSASPYLSIAGFLQTLVSGVHENWGGG